METVVGDVVSRCACEHCTTHVPIAEGNLCERCAGECVIACVDVDSGRASSAWRDDVARRRAHWLRSQPVDPAPDPVRDAAAAVDQEALRDLAQTATQRAASLFARTLRDARRDAVTRYGRAPVAIAEGLAAGAIALGATKAASALAARRRRP